jgi:hypothetical protein
MKTLIEMPPEHYDLFVAELDIKSPEYTTLKNGVVDAADRVVTILCDREEAMDLLEAADRRYPAAVPAIKNALELAR